MSQFEVYHLSLIDSTQALTNLRVETLSDTSLLFSWELLENNLVFQNMTFSIYLGFGIYEDLAGTTEDFYFEVTGLLTNANYTIRVESVIPYSTQMISSTTYHFLESEEVTGPTVLIYKTSQSTQTSMTTPVNQVLQVSNLLSDYSPFILIGGILIIVILLVLFVVIVVVTCCMKKKRRAVKHINTTTPHQHTNPILFELPPHTNEIYEECAHVNPVYMHMLEKDEDKIDLGIDKISLSNISSNHYDV